MQHFWGKRMKDRGELPGAYPKRKTFSGPKMDQ